MLAKLVSALAGRYEIERELGRGGMATVYLAHDVRHDRHVAIKVLDPELASSVGPDRFLREIATAARLTHPNILPLHDSGDAAGLLYYVMPYVRGESLRRRLDRERQLPIDDAIGIARQVASALDYAHLQGVVHRDIKPENILMGEGGQAIVADFGLARVVYDAPAAMPLTATGMSVGTPAYMSPEQASGERAIDARTDVYSLGCVVFEMIAGLPPFRGATAQAIVAHHLATPAPSLCIDRGSCPEAVDVAVRRALAKTPADRFRSAGEFVRAMDVDAISAGVGPYVSGRQGRVSALRPDAQRQLRVRTLVGGGILAAAAIGAAGYAALGGTSSPDLDPLEVLIMPFSIEPEDSVTRSAASSFQRHLRDALSEWDGLKLTLPSAAGRALSTADDARSVTGALDIAREIGAGRLVRGTVERMGDSIVASARAYDVGSETELRAAELTYAASAAPSGDGLRRLANAMLRIRDELPLRVGVDSQRPNLAAWLAYDAGREALQEWRLEAAEARFRTAVTADANHAAAQLWLAQTLTWRDDRHSRGDRLQAAQRATELSTRLATRDAGMAEGLFALAQSRYPQACEAFRRILATSDREFAAWYGLGDCQTRDSVIVEDQRSKSGFAFRGSFHSGLKAYRRALETLPAMRPDFAYLRPASLLQTEINQQREGYRVAADTIRYRAYPTLLGDTLAYIPYPIAMLASAMPEPEPRAQARALQRNMEMQRDLLVAWVRAAPTNANAHEQLAGTLETMGDISPATRGQISALTATAKARALTADTLRKLALASAEVRLLLKNEDFDGAARLADSLLRVHPEATPDQADILVGLAALTGRLARATELTRLLSATTHAPIWENGRRIPIAPQVAQRLAPARASALLGICTDSLKNIREWVGRSLESHYPDPAERTRVLNALIWRPLSQAAPCLEPSVLAGVVSNDRLLRLQQTFDSAGAGAFREGFDSLVTARRGLRPGDVAIDYTFHEASLLASAGDTTYAARYLDRTLLALPTLGTYLLTQPSQAAGLVRAMALRAELAHAQGETNLARRWSGAVLALWKDADPELQARVNEMRVLAGGA